MTSFARARAWDVGAIAPSASPWLRYHASLGEVPQVRPQSAEVCRSPSLILEAHRPGLPQRKELEAWRQDRLLAELCLRLNASRMRPH